MTMLGSVDSGSASALGLELLDQLRQDAEIVAFGRRLGDERQGALMLEENAAHRPQEIAARAAPAMGEHRLRAAQQQPRELRNLRARDVAGRHGQIAIFETALFGLDLGLVVVELSGLLVVGPVVDDNGEARLSERRD